MLNFSSEPKINKYLQSAQQLVAIEGIKNPDDFSSFQEMVFREELRREITWLKGSLKDLKTFSEKFRGRCHFRALMNQNSCLSFMFAPESVCNQLYWDIAKEVFEPKTLSEMLAIILPQVKCYLSFEAVIQQDVPFTTKAPRNLKLNLELANLTDLREDLGEINRLNHFILANNVLFRVSDIGNFTIPLHQQFNKAIMQTYPELGAQLYRHNNLLKSVLSQLHLLSTQGQSPREVLTRLVRELNEGGERNTGKEFASSRAAATYLDCREYLSALPSPMKEAVYSLTDDSNGTLLEILDDSHDCVETAASQLVALLNKTANANTLTKLPYLNPEEKTNLIKQFNLGLRNNFSSERENEITVIPDYWLKRLLSKIRPEDSANYLSFLLSLSPQNYPVFLQEVVLGYPFFFSEELAERIAEGVLSEDQLTALNRAIVDIILQFNRPGSLIEKWVKALRGPNGSSHVKEVLTFAILGNNPALLHLACHKYGSEVSDALNKIIKDNLPLLEYACTKPKLFRAILQLLPEANRLSILAKKNVEGKCIIYLASVFDEENLGTIFSVLSKEDPQPYTEYQALVKHYNKLDENGKLRYISCLQEQLKENRTPTHQFFQKDNAKLSTQLFLLISGVENEEFAYTRRRNYGG